MRELDGAPLSSAWSHQRLRNTELITVLCVVLLLVVAFFTLYPIWLLLVNSFQIGVFGRETGWGLQNWQNALSNPRIVDALKNTVALAATRQGIAMILGIALAWLIARTNLPFRNWLEFGFWVGLILPTLPILLGWILLFDGQQGLVNGWLMELPFITQAPFEVYSWWGIVFVHLMLGTLSIKVFLLTPAFRNMDSALEEASRVAGATTLETLRRIVVPLLLPTILVVLVLGFIRSTQAFEIELILGSRERIDVYSTLMYRQVMREPPGYASATAMAMIVLAAIVPFVALQQWLVLRRNRVTVSGKYAGRLFDLGRLRWPLFAAVFLLLVAMILVPTAFMVLGSFMKIFARFDLAEPWTTAHWLRIMRDPLLVKSIQNTLILGVASTVFSVVLFTLIAYVAARTKFAARGMLDFLTWMPSLVPGIIASLGILFMFIAIPVFRPIYGTIWILVIAIGFAGLTIGVQLIKTSLIQLSAEMEEASWVLGAGRVQTIRRIVLPLIAPTVAIVALQNFAAATAAVALIAFLGSGSNQPLSLLQLQYINTGLFESAGVVGVLIAVVTIAAATLARYYGLRSRMDISPN